MKHLLTFESLFEDYSIFLTEEDLNENEEDLNEAKKSGVSKGLK